MPFAADRGMAAAESSESSTIDPHDLRNQLPGLEKRCTAARVICSSFNEVVCNLPS